jgi:hypothetical protein
MRVVALERDQVDLGLLQLGEVFLILTPLRPERLFPVGVGLDAVAVADVNRRFAFEPFDRTLQVSTPE